MMSERRRFMQLAQRNSNEPLIHNEEALLEEIDTGMKLLSDEYPTWTIFTHNDVAPDSNWYTNWRMWQDDVSGKFQECGMRCCKITPNTADWATGYCVSIRDKSENYGKSYNSSSGWINSVWTWQLMAGKALTFAIKRTTDGYYFTLDGEEWTFLRKSFKLQHMTFIYQGGAVKDGGATEMALWLTDDVDTTDYFAKYQ